jgi:hypothetical protein
VRTLCISTRRIGSRAWCAGSWSCPQTGSAVCKPAQTNEASREVLDEHCRTRRCRCQRGSATRRSFGNRGLRPARPPGPFLPRLRPGPWRPLFRPNPTSLSTSVDTGERGASDRKPDDNAGVQCGARECRQGQDHDRSPLLPGNDNPQARALLVDMRCQSDASSHSRKSWFPKLTPAVPGSARRQQLCRAAGLEPRHPRLVCWPTGRCKAEAAMKYRSLEQIALEADVHRGTGASRRSEAPSSEAAANAGQSSLTILRSPWRSNPVLRDAGLRGNRVGDAVLRRPQTSSRSARSFQQDLEVGRVSGMTWNAMLLARHTTAALLLAHQPPQTNADSRV